MKVLVRMFLYHIKSRVQQVIIQGYLSATVHSSPINRFLQCSEIHVSFVLQLERTLRALTAHLERH